MTEVCMHLGTNPEDLHTLRAAQYMQHVRIYGALEGEEGTPRRLDVDSNGGLRLELHGGKVLAGAAKAPSLEGLVSFQVPHQDDVSVEFENDTATVYGVALPRTNAGMFSDSFQKALKAGQVSRLADDTMLTCRQKVEEAVHNSTFNHGVKPQFKASPPELLRQLAQKHPRNTPKTMCGTVDGDTHAEGLSTGGVPLSVKDIRVMSDVLNNPGAALRLLDVSASLDVKGRPPVAKDELELEAEALMQEWGPINEEDEADENLEKLKAAIAPAEYTSLEQAFRQLAKDRLNMQDMFLAALESNTTLTSLDLSKNSLGTLPDGKKSFRQLRRAKRALEDHPALLSLNLSGNDMGPKGTGLIVKGLVLNVCIADLDMSDNGIGDDEEEENDEDAEGDDPAFGEPLVGLEAFADLLKKNKFVKTLSLARNRIKPIELADEEPTDTFGDDQAFYKLLAPLRTFHRLTSLDLSGNELGPGGAFILGAALAKNKSVTSLDIGDCSLCPRGIEALCGHLTGGTSITHLMLRRNSFAGLKGKKGAKASAKAVAAMCSFLASDANRLEMLDLAYNNLGAEHSKTLLSTLASSSTLTMLDLSLNRLCGASTSEYIPDALPSLAAVIRDTPLTHLLLKWNFLQTCGGCALGEALAGSQVEVLDVTQNHLRGEGLSAICKSGDQLKTLRAGANGSCGEAATEVAALMERSTNLVNLDISDNKLATNAASTVLSAVPRSALACLNIGKNMVGPAAAPQAGEAAAKLRTLLCGDNDFGTDAIVKHIIPKLQGNTQLRTLVAWGGQGPSASCLEAANEAIANNNTILELDLGIPLVELQERTAMCNEFTSKLHGNLKHATFQSSSELII